MMKRLLSVVMVLGLLALPVAMIGCEEKPAANTPAAPANADKPK